MSSPPPVGRATLYRLCAEEYRMSPPPRAWNLLRGTCTVSVYITGEWRHGRRRRSEQVGLGEFANERGLDVLITGTTYFAIEHLMDGAVCVVISGLDVFERVPAPTLTFEEYSQAFGKVEISWRTQILLFLAAEFSRHNEVTNCLARKRFMHRWAPSRIAGYVKLFPRGRGRRSGRRLQPMNRLRLH